jgi:hypothetical protein
MILLNFRNFVGAQKGPRGTQGRAWAFCIRYDKKHLKTVDSHLENLYSRKATQLNGETIEQYYKRLKTMYTLAHGDHINNLENLRSYCKIFVSGLFNSELRSRLMEEEYVLIHREGNMDKLLKQALEIHCRIIEANEQIHTTAVDSRFDKLTILDIANELEEF